MFRTERQSARMSKIKNDGLDQYGAEPFEQQQFGTAGVEGVKLHMSGHVYSYVRQLPQNLWGKGGQTRKRDKDCHQKVGWAESVP